MGMFLRTLGGKRLNLTFDYNLKGKSGDVLTRANHFAIYSALKVYLGNYALERTENDTREVIIEVSPPGADFNLIFEPLMPDSVIDDPLAVDIRELINLLTNQYHRIVRLVTADMNNSYQAILAWEAAGGRYA
jgi:hypothetical protein